MHIRKALVNLACIFFVFTANFSFSEQPMPVGDITDSLKRAYETGQYEKAYKLSILNTFDLEGDPEFDLYYGLSALSLGKFPEAQFPFERLVYMEPNNGRYRLEYARTLFHLKHYDEAKTHFLMVFDANPPEAVQYNIFRFLETIEERQKRETYHWFGNISIGTGFDSNINSAPDLEILGNIILDERSQSTESSYLSAVSSFSFNKLLSPTKSLIVNFDSQHRQNDEVSTYNYDTARLRISRKWLGQHNNFQIGASYLQILLEGDAYQTAPGLFAEWQKSWLPTISTQMSAGIAQKKYDLSSELNSLQPNLSFSLLSLVNNAQHGVTVSYSTDQADKEGHDDKMRNSFLFGYQYNKPMTATSALFFGNSYYRIDYQDTHPIFGQERTDTTIQWVIGGRMQFDKNLMVMLEASQAENDSNLELYSYSRERAELKLKWFF